MLITRKTVKSIALPAEHGSWSFWLEPALLGMLVAPSWGGIGLILLSLASLLLRQPLKIALIDIRKKKVYLRTRIAIGFVALYSLIAVISLLLSLTASGTDILMPLVPAYLIAFVQMWLFDSRGYSRHWLPELLGTGVMGAFAVSIAIAGGWELIPALGLLAIMLARSVPTVVYVRTRLRQIKGQSPDIRPSVILHLAAMMGLIALVTVRLVPLLTVMAGAILLGRTVYYLRQSRIVAAKVIGIQEILYGLLTVGLAVAGYILHI